MNKAPASVLIVGGGTAGWMTACLLAKHWLHANSPTQITLIESSDIGTIGVGEGSTPYLKAFFQQLGIPESQWMPACDATYKVGISFANWRDRTPCSTPNNSYFHPFFTPFDVPSGNAFFDAADQRRNGINANTSIVHTHPADFFVAAELVRQGVAPVSMSDNLKEDIDYAYHFDAGKLGELLKNYAKEKGVKHIVDNIVGVKSANIESANVKSAGAKNAPRICSVESEKHGELSASLYIDCSGFRGILAKQALQRSFHSYRDTLFNDAAVAIATPHSDDPQTNPAQILQTESNALNAGWMWRIPLTSRMGNGYVYSSQFLSETQAEQELRHALNLQRDADIPARHLTMQVGRLQHHWQGNCAAIGLSQGFIEPLEATALMLVQYAITQLVEHWQSDWDNDCQHSQQQNRYNREMNRMFDGIRDYIAAHYFLNNRTNTRLSSEQRFSQELSQNLAQELAQKEQDYWQACRENMHVPPVLEHLVNAWDNNHHFDHALQEVEQELVYLKPSWYCIFAGMERFAAMPEQLRSAIFANNDQSQITQSQINQKQRQYLRKVVKENFG